MFNQVKQTKFSLQCESKRTNCEQTAKNCLSNPKFQQGLNFTLWLYPAAGKGLYKKLNAQQPENLREFLQNPFFLSFESILFFSFREFPSDQESMNGLAAKLLWFLGHRVASMMFRHLTFWCGYMPTAGKGLKITKCQAVRKCSGISAKFLSFSNRLKVFYIHLE